MAVYCLNRHRGKRTIPPQADPHPGRPNCPGRLVVALNVAVLIPLKSNRDERPDTMLSKYVLRYGVRLTPAALVEALRRADVRCDSCGYSRARLLAATRTKAARDGTINRRVGAAAR